MSDREDEDPRVVAHAGGMLLGGAADKYGGMYLADATRGLLYIPPNSSSEQSNDVRIVSALAPSDLSNAASSSALDDHEIRYANDIAVDHESGVVYFTDATRIAPTSSTDRRDAGLMIAFGTSHLSGEASGRVLCYVPDTGKTYVLATNIRFANGIALSKDRTHLIVASTSSYVLYKVPTPTIEMLSSGTVKAIPAAELELFHQGPLPGMPDGLTVAPDGTVWVPFFSPVLLAQRLADVAPAFLRYILVRIPYSFRPGTSSVRSTIAVFSAEGQVIRVLHDKRRKFGLLTSVERCGEYLYCGCLKCQHVARFHVGDVQSNNRRRAS